MIEDEILNHEIDFILGIPSLHSAHDDNILDRDLNTDTGLTGEGFQESETRKAAREGGGFDVFGGADGDRTHDLSIANAALSQLSYGPTRAADITVIALTLQGYWRLSPKGAIDSQPGA